MEDEVLANAGVDVFEEVFKLIFTKLYDEHQSKTDKEILHRALKNNLGNYWYRDFNEVKNYLSKFTDDRYFRVLEFRNTGQSDTELKKKIQKLFESAKQA